MSSPIALLWSRFARDSRKELFCKGISFWHRSGTIRVPETTAPGLRVEKATLEDHGIPIGKLWLSTCLIGVAMLAFAGSAVALSYEINAAHSSL